MAWISTGTVNVTNGSTAVVGVGTSWFGSLQAGWGFIGPDGRVLEVATVNSATSVTLVTPYQGATASGQAYAFFPTMSLRDDLTVSVLQLLSDFSGVRDGPGEGKFPLGSEAVPAIRAEADPDTGIRFRGSNLLTLVTGGVDRLDVNALGQVGIGTKVQDEPLVVQGDIKAKSAAPSFKLEETDATANNKLWRMTAQGGDLVIQALTDALAGGGGNVAFVRDDQNITQMVGKWSGNARWTLDADDTSLTFGIGDGTIKTDTPSALIFGTNGNERMRIASSGNIGMGTSSPEAYLHISANAPTLMLEEEDADANESKWRFRSVGGEFRLETLLDNGDFGDDAFTIERAAAVVSGFRFKMNSAVAMRLDENRNLVLGAGSAGADAVGALCVRVGTAPSAAMTNGAMLFAQLVSSTTEMRVMDSAGNVTTISPHNFDLVGGPSEPMAWAFYSERDGRAINVDMLAALRVLERISGESLVHISEV